MSKPYRSPAHLAFIRSLPCCVCLRTRNVEACHTPGSRGMSQKADDRLTIPMCSIHHKEQHRIGWKRFSASYDLDIAALLNLLTERPRLEIDPSSGCWHCCYRGQRFWIGRFQYRGFGAAWQIVKHRCTEIAIDELVSVRRVKLNPETLA